VCAPVRSELITDTFLRSRNTNCDQLKHSILLLETANWRQTQVVGINFEGPSIIIKILIDFYQDVIFA
jgi:hypothetical protein